MLSSLPGKHHRPLMRLGGIIYALCCMRISIIHYAHYGARRLRGGQMLSSLPGKHHRPHMRLGGIIYALWFMRMTIIHYSLWGSSVEGRRNAQLPARKTPSSAHAIGRYHTCTMLYEDDYHTLCSLWGSSVEGRRNAQLPAESFASAARAHRGIIDTLFYNILKQKHSNYILRSRGKWLSTAKRLNPRLRRRCSSLGAHHLIRRRATIATRLLP